MNRTQLSQLVVFAAVAREGNFRAAAQSLQIAPSAVSHAISELENSLGLRLLARSTRSTRPTEEGERLLESVIGPLAEIELGLTTISEMRSSPSGALCITMPLLIAEGLIAPHLADFSHRFPDIELDIRTDDRFEDIVASGCDAGIRLGERLEADMIAVPIGGQQRGCIVGTPAYFELYPPPKAPQDLMDHRCIRRRFSSGQIYRWELEKEDRSIVIDVKGPLILSHQNLIYQATIQGAGLAYLFYESIVEDLKDGRLVSVLDDWTPSFDGFYIYYSSRQHVRPALRAFIDFFKEKTPSMR